MTFVEKVANTVYLVIGIALATLAVSLVVSFIFFLLEMPPTKESEVDMGGLCMSLCKKEYGHHITKAAPVNGGGCYCYP
jgi:hypothetical protein